MENFLKKSKYYKEPINKEKIEEAFKAKQPQLIKTVPLLNGNTLVDTSLKQITFVFSKPMGKGISINYGDKGKETYPITSVIGFSDDKTRFTIGIDLEPNHDYEFVITNRTFRSEEGYPLLKDYPIKFKTKP